jgi:hypothetical protein
MAGIYHITIRRILDQKQNRHGDIILEIEGTRNLVEERPSEGFFEGPQKLRSQPSPGNSQGRILPFRRDPHR